MRRQTVDSAGSELARVRDMIAGLLGEGKAPGRLRIIQDTTDYFRVDYDDVLSLGGRHYLIRHYEREGRFGIDEQPKFWVRRAVDLEDGSLKVIKMVFHEKFTTTYGGMVFECVRSSAKEGRILELTSGHPRFMQGFTVADTAGNPVRVIDHIKGRNLAEHAAAHSGGHEEYYFTRMPGLLGEFRELVRAIGFLHDNEQTHGDIRRDHIILDTGDGLCKWIDFDYSCFHRENLFAYDLAGLGNVLLFLVGGGDVTIQQLRKERPDVLESIGPDDMNLVFHNRVANLGKVYPYISEGINYMLRHFSSGAMVYYRNTGEMLEDLDEALTQMEKERI